MQGSQAPVDDMFSTRPFYYTNYFVDGFRSLRQFSLRLEEGLNVFVGPNGAGKTNFIDLLDFSSTFFSRGLAAATSNAGGIARVFSQEALRSRIPRIQVEVSGIADLMGHISDEDDQRTLFRFVYGLDIRYSRAASAVYVAAERIKFHSLFWRDLASGVSKTVGTLSLRRRSPSEDAELEVDIGSRLSSRGVQNPLRYRARYRRYGSRSNDPQPDDIEIPYVGPDQSLFAQRGNLPALDAVKESLSRGRSFNLNPAVARQPSEITAPPIINSDGSGLSSSLFHLDQARQGRVSARAVSRRYEESDLNTIIEWTRLVLPELTDITTVADPHTGSYLSTFIVSFGDQSLRIPLQGLSDGTLKWLSFVCLIISSGSPRSIEEPENFLHPKMQRMLINLIRETMSSDHPGYFLISTHSESIINQCRPEELIIFKFSRGSTTSSRLKRPEKVAEQINSTGFGLGYYYASNAIS
jgi:predicted ATPase